MMIKAEARIMQVKDAIENHASDWVGDTIFEFGVLFFFPDVFDPHGMMERSNIPREFSGVRCPWAFLSVTMMVLGFNSFSQLRVAFGGKMEMRSAPLGGPQL